MNAAYRLTPRFQAGLEFNPAVGELVPTANWVALTETDTQPMVSFGTSSDRIFSPEGNQAYYVTVARSAGNRAAGYLSLSWSEWQEKFLLPFGMNFALDPKHDLMVMNDGVNTHLLVTRKFESSSITLMLVKMERLGISYSWALK